MIVLARIDDRLLHGQVAVGWIPRLRAERVVIVDDDVAAATWEADLYRAAGPPGVEVRVASVAEAGSLEEAKDAKTILLVRSPATLLELLVSGVVLSEANVGGMHYDEGKKSILPYVYVDGKDASDLRKIAARGIRVVAQDVPASSPVEILPLLPPPRAD